MKHGMLFIAVLLMTALSPILRAQDRADFIYVDRGDVSTLDPNRMSWLQDIRVGYGLYEGLYTLLPGTLECVPGAAGKIDVSADKRLWTFHIRPTARWSNGDPVVSGDFVFAWRRMLESPGEYTYLLHYINGAENYENQFAKDAKKADFSLVGIKTPDAATLIVTLTHPVTFFPDLCAFTPYWPLHEKSLARFKRVDRETGRATFDEQFTNPPNLISNGPYKLVKWQLKIGLRLEKNEHYWDAQNVKTGSIELQVVDEPLTALRKYESREVDWLAEPNGEIASNLKSQGRKDLHIVPAFGTYFYSINCLEKLPNGRDNPLKDVRVRQALSMAIDRRPIVETITRCGEPISTTYVPPGVFPNYPSPKGFDLDIKAARALMKQAGYPAGKNFPRLKLLFNTEGDHRTVAQYVTKQWKNNLNIDIDLEGVEIAQFRQRLHAKDYDIARASWYGDYNDISTFTDKYLSKSDNNDSGWVNAEYDQLCAQATIESNAAKRTQLLAKAEAILINEQPIIPLYTYTNRTLFRDEWKGLFPHARNLTLFKYVQRDK